MESFGSCFYALHFFFFFWRSQGVSLWRSSASDFSEQVKARLPFDDRISWKGISQSLISFFPVTSLQNIGLIGMVLSLLASPGPGPKRERGTEKKYRCYVHMCLYIHKLQALVWNWCALISEATLELGIRKRASNTREESSNTEDHSLRDGWRQPNLCGNPSVESSSMINEARAHPERWGVFLQTVDIGRIRASQPDVSLSSQSHNSCWMNGRSSLSLSYTLHFSPLFLVRSHLVQHSLHAGPFV